jgi:hypothetical protein
MYSTISSVKKTNPEAAMQQISSRTPSAGASPLPLQRASGPAGWSFYVAHKPEGDVRAHAARIVAATSRFWQVPQEGAARSAHLGIHLA